MPLRGFLFPRASEGRSEIRGTSHAPSLSLLSRAVPEGGRGATAAGSALGLRRPVPARCRQLPASRVPPVAAAVRPLLRFSTVSRRVA